MNFYHRPGSVSVFTQHARTAYPSKHRITQIFSSLSEGNFTAFFAHVAPDVHWTLMGTHPLAGQYFNRTIFATDALLRLDATFDPLHPSTLKLINVVGGGDEEWSSQELHGLGICKNGKSHMNVIKTALR